MGEAYSEDLRQRILRAVDRGLPVRQVSGLYEVSTSFIYKALIRRRTTGETGARARGGRVAKKLVGHHEALLERVRLEPDITLSELQGWLLKTFGVSSSIGGLWNTLNKLGLSFKKTCHAAERTRPDVRQARAAWQERQCSFNPAQLIFIDETSAATHMARRYGRSPHGQRLVAAIAHGHWKTTTFVAGLRHTQLSAPLVIDGPMNGTTP